MNKFISFVNISKFQAFVYIIILNAITNPLKAKIVMKCKKQKQKKN